MAKIDTDLLWQSLGTFWDFFPEEERVYFATFWESWADLTADLWSYAVQIDRAKNLFKTTPTFQRSNVLIKLDNFRESRTFEFALSSVITSPQGLTTIRGFVPRELRNFRARDVPSSGIIRIGVDTIEYSAVNITTIVGGEFDGFVREAIFTIDVAPPHDYSDSKDLNDSFFLDSDTLEVRIDHAAGVNYIDSVLEDPNAPIDVNPTGRVIIGEEGINAESFEYQSVAIIADRYLFTLPSTYRLPAAGPSTLLVAHVTGEPVTILRYDENRWQEVLLGAARIIAENQAIFVIDDEPGVTAAAKAELEAKYEIKENSDFDLSAFLEVDAWETPLTVSSERLAGTKIVISGIDYFVGYQATPGGTNLVHGPLSSLTAVAETLPLENTELRLKRVGTQLEFQVKREGDADFAILGTEVVTGGKARLSLVLEDDGTSSASQVRFDEVLRRIGEIAGSTRLESEFTASESLPYKYDIDQRITEASLLIDKPRQHQESLTTIETVSDAEAVFIRAIGGQDFDERGLQESGTLIVENKEVTYEQFTVTDSVVEFRLRQKLDPDILPLAAGAIITAQVREITADVYSFTGDGTLELRDLPTRDRMWAPIAFVDERHVQQSFGELVDLTADVSTEAYLRRVQGAWFALQQGPAIGNIHTGLQLTMGLPAAQASGVVDRIETLRDSLGNIQSRDLIIINADGEFRHPLGADLPDINFIYNPGDAVERFAPLTDGVEIVDQIVDDLWYQLFAGQVADAERFNAFGVFVSIEALSANASFDDAIRFVERIKGHWTKVFLHFRLTNGNEDVIIEEDLFATQVLDLCEDVSFDEGTPPPTWQDPLRFGDGHKMGQGKVFGGPNVFQAFPAMGLGLFFGTGLTFGMQPRAFSCDPDDSNLPSEITSSSQVITFEAPP